MQVHEIKKPKHNKPRKRVGRGGKRGTYSGRGIKGQKARAGANIRPQIWDYILETPKLKGPVKKGSVARGRSSRPVFVVNIQDLQDNTKSGDVVNVDYLVKNGIVRKHKGRKPSVKILGKGELKKKLTVEGVNMSGQAKEKIESAGGEVK